MRMQREKPADSTGTQLLGVRRRHKHYEYSATAALHLITSVIIMCPNYLDVLSIPKPELRMVPGMLDVTRICKHCAML